MIYVNKFNTASEAISASGLVYPQVVYVEDETSLLIPGSEYENGDEMVIERDQSGDLIIDKVVLPYAGLKMTSTGTSTVKINKMVYSYSNRDAKYSLDDGSTWTQYTYGTDEIITLQDGESVCFKGLNEFWSKSGPNYNNFTITGNVAISGNPASLLDDGACTTTILPQDAFNGLFRNCTGITDASGLVLPFTILSSTCYMGMFQGCTGLVSVPYDLLPATTLAIQCYGFMFNGCTSLQNAPYLPAATLEYGCYNSMFKGCSSLNNIKCLATDITANTCVSNWVDGVASSGTFTKNAEMTNWTEGASGIPSGWAVQNAQ